MTLPVVPVPGVTPDSLDLAIEAAAKQSYERVNPSRAWVDASSAQQQAHREMINGRGDVTVAYPVIAGALIEQIHAAVKAKLGVTSRALPIIRSFAATPTSTEEQDR